MSERLTAERLEELRRIAEAANTGDEWIPEKPLGTWFVFVPASDEDDEEVRETDSMRMTVEVAHDEEAVARHAAEFDPPTVLALLGEVERLWRERETLAALLRQVDVVMDGAAMMGVSSIMAPRYRDDWAVVHTRVREHLALLDGEKGGVSA